MNNKVILISDKRVEFIGFIMLILLLPFLAILSPLIILLFLAPLNLDEDLLKEGKNEN